MHFLKATLIGGVAFLVPVVVLMVVFGKAFELMSRLAAPVQRFVPVESVGGIAVADLVTVLAMVLVCFLAGLFAMSRVARRFYHRLDGLLMLLPGYAFIKSFSQSLSLDASGEALMVPVQVRFDDYSQLCFEVGRADDGEVTIYLPGAPDPWSGSLIRVAADRVERLTMSMPQAVGYIRNLGRERGAGKAS